MKKQLFVIIQSISILFYFTSNADLYDLYGLDQVRDRFPAEIQNLIARYIMPFVDSSFMAKLGNYRIWKLTKITYRKPILYPSALPTDRTPALTFMDIINSPKNGRQPKRKNVACITQLAPNTLIIKSHDQQQPIVQPKPDNKSGIISYPQGTVINSFSLDQHTLTVHVNLDTNEEHTWQPSQDIKDYLAYNAITLEQVLFLIFINQLHAKTNSTGAIDFAQIAYNYQYSSLSKNLPTNSLQAIIDYLDAILKSFGSQLESSIVQHYTIKNSALGKAQYQLLSYAQKILTNLNTKTFI